MNCATTNTCIDNDKLSFENGIKVYYIRTPIDSLDLCVTETITRNWLNQALVFPILDDLFRSVLPHQRSRH